jgi:lipopolysaccharide export system protein LptA
MVFLFSLFLAFFSSPALAAEGPPSPALPFDPAGQFQLKAAEHLEWQPQSQTLSAEGKVNLTYKGFTLKANQARLAYQGDPAGGNTQSAMPAIQQIRSFNLEGNVFLNNDLYEITAAKADYRFADQRLILTGDPVTLKNATDTAKIWGTVTVDLAKSRIDGTGPVHLTRQSYDVKGKDVTLMFQPWNLDKLQEAVLDTAELLKDVILTYPELNVTGDHALYDQAKQTVTMTNNVVLTRQNSVIKTNQAILDLTTQRVRLTSPNQPVTGNIHVPDFDKPKDKVSP